MTTLTDALLERISTDRMGPRITYYDDASGERIELSTVTLANWAAKTANLLRDELGAGPGTRVAVLLPAHWQTVAVLLGVWWIGAEVVIISPPGRSAPAAVTSPGRSAPAPVTSPGRSAPAPVTSPGRSAPAPEADSPADIALCTIDRLDEADAVVNGGEVAVLSLDPFGKPVEGLPIGVTDYATAVRVHGDQIAPERFPGPALAGRSVDEVLVAAGRHADSLRLTSTDRVMCLSPLSVDHLLAVLAAGASLVQVAHPDPALLERRRVSEKVTRTLE